jgi:hypothetical protein
VPRDEPPGQGGGRSGEADFHGQKRSNDTHASTTDPEARLYRKGLGKEAKLCFLGMRCWRTATAFSSTPV